MFHDATQSSAWLVSDTRNRVRRNSARISSAQPAAPARAESKNASDPTATEDLLSIVLILSFSIVVIAATAWISREIMTDLARFHLHDLLRGMIRIP